MCWTIRSLSLVAGIVLAGLATTAWAQPRSESKSRPRTMKPLLNAENKDDEVNNFVENVNRPSSTIDVILGQGRLITLKQDLAQPNKQAPVIAAGDPSVLDFDLVGPRQIRITGNRIGVTDIAITTPDQRTFSFEVRVVMDVELLGTRLTGAFPDASIELEQIRDHIIVRGEARDTRQAERILETIEAYLYSIQAAQLRRIQSQQLGSTDQNPRPEAPAQAAPGGAGANPQDINAVENNLRVTGAVATPKIINLLRIPGSQQVMLKVQVAELNRTGLRKMGVSFQGTDGTSSFGTNISGSNILSQGASAALPFANSATTVAGLLTNGNGSVAYTVEALRRNSLLKILAEPTLVAYHGHEATFLAGGEFPVPVTQGGSSVGAVTVQFKEFGVRLGFIPHILDDERIRLAVTPEVSTIDPSLAINLSTNNINNVIPALSTRRFNTTVELRQGQTLAMAGLLQVTLENQTNRVPGLGDIPVMGAFFSNNSGQRVEKELIVLVTPYLVEPIEAHEVGPLPGSEINEPNDLEFYLLGRIESRVGCDFRSTTKWDDPLHLVRRMKLESRYCSGPVGYSCPGSNGPACR